MNTNINPSTRQKFDKGLITIKGLIYEILEAEKEIVNHEGMIKSLEVSESSYFRCIRELILSGLIERDDFTRAIYIKQPKPSEESHPITEIDFLKEFSKELRWKLTTKQITKTGAVLSLIEMGLPTSKYCELLEITPKELKRSLNQSKRVLNQKPLKDYANNLKPSASKATL